MPGCYTPAVTFGVLLLAITGCAPPDGDTAVPVDPDWSLAGCVVTSQETTHMDGGYPTTLTCTGTVHGEPWVYPDWRLLSWDCLAEDGRTRVTTADWTAEGCESAFTEVETYASGYIYETARAADCDEHGYPIQRSEVQRTTWSDGTTDTETTSTLWQSTYVDDVLVSQVAESLDGGWTETYWFYDNRGRVERWEEAGSEATESWTTLAELSYEGGLLASERHQRIDAEGEVWSSYLYGYDTLDRRVQETLDSGEDGVVDETVTQVWQADTPWIASYDLDYTAIEGPMDHAYSFSYRCP